MSEGHVLLNIYLAKYLSSGIEAQEQRLYFITNWYFSIFYKKTHSFHFNFKI